jgi:hypothetical protein
MEKDQRLVGNHHGVPLQGAETIIVHIPRCQIGAFMLQHDYILKTAWPVIQVLLIGKTAILDPIIAPLNTPFTPPP